MQKTLNRIIAYFAIIIASYHIYITVAGIKIPILHRVFHLTWLLSLLFLQQIEKSKTIYTKIINLLLALLCFSSGFYYWLEIDRIVNRWPFASKILPLDLIFGVALILLVLEGTRRWLGLPLVIVVCAMLGYTYFGAYFPGVWNHAGFTVPKIVDHLFFTTEGLFGIPIGVSSTFVFLFVLFGCFLESSGGGDFFIDLGNAVAGKARGGAAKVAIVTSALFGSINGSPVANTVTTGTITIPMMKKMGYRPEFAGAVEAVASTGGALMPPIMGTAAFMMVEVTGISYLEIIKAAAIPALLYFLCVFLFVDFEAAKQGLKGLPKEKIPNIIIVFKKGWQFLTPIVIVVILLARGMAPILAAFYAMLATIAASWVRKETRLYPKQIIKTLEKSSYTAASVAVACAAAGIVISGISLSALTGKATSIILGMVDQMLLPSIFLTMVICLILGMGMPLPAAYILTATLAVPSLIRLGVTPMAAHLFAVYFAGISAITPPVAVAAYAAAGIAGVSSSLIGWIAFKIGLAGFIIPYLFVYDPAMLLIGTVPQIILITLTAITGITALAGGIQGWFLMPLGKLLRIILIACGLLLVYPSLITDIAGLGLAALIFAKQYFALKKKKEGITA